MSCYSNIENVKFMPFNKIKTLGSGSYGIVYLIELANQDEYAMKVMNLDLDDFYTSYILNEINNLQMLYNSPNILQLQGVCYKNDSGYMFMDRMNIDLFEYILDAPFEEKFEQLDNFIVQLCSGLYSMKTVNLAHNDIKSENILIDTSNYPNKFVLADLGASSFKEKELGVVGTLEFLSPEKLYSFVEKNVTTDNYAADIWALGVVILEYITATRVINFNDSDFNIDYGNNNDIRSAILRILYLSTDDEININRAEFEKIYEFVEDEDENINNFYEDNRDFYGELIKSNKIRGHIDVQKYLDIKELIVV